jgi:hypothetical protein
VQDNSFFWAPRGEGEPSALKRARHASVAEAITHTSSDITPTPTPQKSAPETIPTTKIITDFVEPPAGTLPSTHKTTALRSFSYGHQNPEKPYENKGNPVNGGK